MREAMISTIASTVTLKFTSITLLLLSLNYTKYSVITAERRQMFRMIRSLISPTVSITQGRCILSQKCIRRRIDLKEIPHP